MMIRKSAWLLLWVLGAWATSFAQQSHVFTDAERQFKEAKQYFVQKQYGLAYPVLQQLKTQQRENTKSNAAYLFDDVNYYYTVCRLKLQLPVAAEEAEQYIEWVNNNPRAQLMSYHLGRYYFEKDNFNKAIANYEWAGLANLSNEEIADAKFEMAYCYFNLKNFDKAKPLFNEIHQMPNSRYYLPANYYFGFISFYQQDFSTALKCFRLVESMPEYKGVVPYYIAEIFYFQNQKDEALRYGESVVSRGGLYYDKEMKQLLGQIYFEKRNFKKAQPYLEEYVQKSEKVSKEDLYELSYSYYENNQIDKAIDGLKQLSNEKDSMGQNAMYLLGDCYLRKGDKANARNAFQFCASNSSHAQQREIARFQYAKLSYELGFQDAAINELQQFIADYPSSAYAAEAKEIAIALLANTNNYKDALAIYQSFAKPTTAMQKVYPRILYGRAVEQFNDQQWQQADELFSKVLSLPASNATPYAQFWKGELAMRNNNTDEAIRFFTLFLQAAVPAQGEANAQTARYNLGYAWMRKENYRQAQTYFEAVSKPNVTASAMEQDAYLRQADCLFMQKEFAKANGMYNHVVNTAMQQSDYALYQTAVIAGIKNTNSKINILNALIRQYPQSQIVPDANMEIATTYMADEKFTEALPFLKQVTSQPNAAAAKPAAYLKTGLCYFNMNKNQDALAAYTTLLKEYPNSPEADDAIDNIKAIYTEEGKPGEYVALMRSSGKNISNGEADTLTYNAAYLKYENGQCPAAIDGFKNYVGQFATGVFVAAAHFYSADCYTKTKNMSAALAAYQAVVAQGINPFYERAALQGARIAYFEQKDYGVARALFDQLRNGASTQENQLEALRGLIRCYYQLKDYANANDVARHLLAQKSVSTDDKSIANLVLGKALQTANNCAEAISAFKACAAINKTAWGAEARYELAACQFAQGNTAAAEKAAQATIKETGSYDYWVIKSYILLGDVFLQQKDYFNAKATYESVAQNASIAELKTIAEEKLAKAKEEEKTVSKL
jgi:tetratricopeptide (TPR) repeat protein